MTAARNEKNYFAFICVVLALGTLALYWPVTGHPFILYDDTEYITANTHVTTGLSEANFIWAFKSGEAANWHPLTWLSHQLDCTLFGLHAGAHHFVGLLFHIANALLVLVFLRSATGALWRSALVAALFAWHPLHVESVAWASERKDVLSTFFWLLTLIAYVRHVNGVKGQSRRAWLFYALALIFFAAGLMSKPMVVTLPCVLVLLDFWPLNRFPAAGTGPGAWLRLALEKMPFFLLAAAGSVVTYLVQTGAGAQWAAPLSERLANAVIAYARYTIKLCYPTDLAIIYSHPQHWSIIVALGAVALLAVWTVPILLQWRARPFLAVGWFWFLGTLVPTIGLVQVGAQAMADRYTYIPSIGFFLTVVWGGWEYLSTRPRGRELAPWLAGGALLICACLLEFQISYWSDNKTLFLHAIEVSPDNYVAENCLGKAYEMEGDMTHALVLYRNAVGLEPNYPQSQFNYAIALVAFGERAEAQQHFQIAAALEPGNPDIQFDLGVFFSQSGAWADAVDHLKQSAAVKPNSAATQYYLGAALVHLGKLPEAAACFREALRLQPGYAAADMDLKTLLAGHSELK